VAAERRFEVGKRLASESTAHRVLAAEGLVVPGQLRREPILRSPWPDWLQEKPNRVWAYDVTHISGAAAVIAILDVVSRTWLTTLSAAEETSTQAEVAFIDTLAAEDLLGLAHARATVALRAALERGDPRPPHCGTCRRAAAATVARASRPARHAR